MRYRPDLDGIRAIAVLAVMGVHTTIWGFAGGWMGVDVFFVLSGFLITTLLVGEHAHTGAVSLRRFYARRVLRLYPALLAVVVAFGIVFALGYGYGPSTADYSAAALRTVLYVEDISAGLGRQDAFHHGWSLAVEEQFYLLWAPLLILLLRRGRNPLRWAVAGAVVSWVWCAATVSQGPGSIGAAMFFPWNRMAPLLIGAALAMALARGVRAPAFIASRIGGVLAAEGAVLVVMAGASYRADPNVVWESPAIAIATCAVIWHLTVTADSPLRRLLGWAPLCWLGRRSYAMYLIHLPLLYLIASRVDAPLQVQSALMIVSTVALAAVSYTVVEMPFLRLKARLHTVPAAFEGAQPPDERGAAHSYLRVGIPLATK